MRHKEFPRWLILVVASTTTLIVIWTCQSNSTAEREYIVRNNTNTSSSSQMVEDIRANHLIPPSTKDYNLSAPGTFETPYFSSGSMVLRILRNLKTGVFIEAGAFDGEEGSNSLPLELLGWKGILVECNPQVLSKLKSKNRKAWIADVCLSTSQKSGSVKLFSSPEWPASAQINRQLSEDEMKVHGILEMKNKTWAEYERPSFPLSSIIEAVGEFKQIDFLSLDVQGAEIDILYNYPFEKFPIKVIIAEIFTFDAKQRKYFRKFLEGKGYKLYAGDNSDYTFVLKQSFD